MIAFELSYDKVMTYIRQNLMIITIPTTVCNGTTGSVCNKTKTKCYYRIHSTQTVTIALVTSRL